MRAFSTLTASLLLLSAHAQWPTDPNNPLVICNDASNQKDIHLVDDGTGGWYVLWRDNRLGTNRYALFGQRINSQGIPQWEANGRLIQAVPGRSINHVGTARMADGKLFVAYISGANALAGDTVRAMAYDSNGQPVWAQPALLAYPGPLPGGGSSTGNSSVRAVAVSGGAYVAWATDPAGASGWIHVARIRPNGSNAMPVQGLAVSSLNPFFTNGPWDIGHDLAGGLMVERRLGNGAGAPLNAQRLDSTGTELWPTSLLVSANSSGLTYEWHTAIAPNGRLNSVWAHGYNLRMAIYDTTGALLNTTAPIDVCLQADVQENPFVVQSDPETTVFWADNRSSAGISMQVFMQRFDAAGNPLLAADGVLALQCNTTTTGFPRAVQADNGTHIVAMVAAFTTGGATPGFRAGRITPTGTNLWSDTTRFCTPALGPNNGSDFRMVSDGDGGAVAVWFNGQNNAIYAARLDRWGRLGDFSSVPELQQGDVGLFPNPATDAITVSSRYGRALGEIRLHGADGRIAREVGRVAADRFTVDVRDLKPGVYMVSCGGGDVPAVLRFVKE